MPAMFVANCTQQTQDFQYRRKGPDGKVTRKLYKQTIPSGRQIRISGDDLTVADIEFIVRQHDRYGMRAATDLDRNQPFVGYCFSIDKPAKPEQVTRWLQHNEGVLDLRGRMIREEAAVAAADIAAQNDGNFQSLDVEIKEVARDGQDIKVDDFVRVDKRMTGAKPKPGSRERRTVRSPVHA